MGIYQIGELIRMSREQQGMTQEELCENVCSVENLSRIENGRVQPNRNTFRELMKKLQKSGELYQPYIVGMDIESHMLKNEITQLLAVHKYREGLEVLKQLTEKLDMTNKYNKQFILRAEAWAKAKIGEYTREEERERLTEALRCTIPQYQEEILPKGLLSRHEILIFSNIATSYAEEGELEKAIVMLKQAEQYFKTIQVDYKERSKSEVMILSNLIRCLGRMGYYEETKIRGEELKKKCLNYGNSRHLGGILYGIAFDKEQLGESQEECKKTMIQAYYVARLNKNTVLMENVKKHVQEIYEENFLEGI
ncbi:MAG: helix-turn-helix transcriptional regulator [bacterium]|nr:helix-turn-helix transcriptional regulator [bacterium]